MPNKHAAIKDLRKSRKRAVRNARMKTHVKSLERQFLALVKEGKKADALEIAKKLQQAASKAAKEHVIHSNKAGHKISRIHKTLAKLK